MSDNKRYYWMKFQRDFFTSLRIKRLRRLAGGDTFTIIYLKLQLLSITTGGYLQYKGIFNTFAEEMAEEIDEELDNVTVTLNFLLQNELMLQDGDSYFLPYAADNIGSETASTLRSQECRKRQKALQCNTEATLLQQNCNVEIEKEKEIDIREKIDYQAIVELYNSSCPSFPKLMSLSDARKKAIKARLKTYSMDDFETLFRKAQASDFLKGKNDRNWSANFDWLIKDSNMAKVMDGNYDNKANGCNSSSKNSFNSFEKTDYNFDEIEK